MLLHVHGQSEGGVGYFKINFVFHLIINSLESQKVCLEQIKERRGMLLLSRRGKWMGKEEWREISKQREGNVPAPGYLGSPSPSLPTGEKWKLQPGREAMTSGASALCGVQGAVPPSPIFREQSTGASSTQAQSPDPCPPAEAGGGSPAVPVTQPMPEDPSQIPEPRPHRTSTPTPSSHL